MAKEKARRVDALVTGALAGICVDVVCPRCIFLRKRVSHSTVPAIWEE